MAIGMSCSFIRVSFPLIHFYVMPQNVQLYICMCVLHTLLSLLKVLWRKTVFMLWSFWRICIHLCSSKTIDIFIIAFHKKIQHLRVYEYFYASNSGVIYIWSYNWSSNPCGWQKWEKSLESLHSWFKVSHVHIYIYKVEDYWKPFSCNSCF